MKNYSDVVPLKLEGNLIDSQIKCIESNLCDSLTVCELKLLLVIVMPIMWSLLSLLTFI